MPTTTSAALTASRTLAVRRAPRSTSGCARVGVRFHTLSSCPCSSKVCASAVPILPVPRIAIRVMCLVLSVLDVDGGEAAVDLELEAGRERGLEREVERRARDLLW